MMKQAVVFALSGLAIAMFAPDIIASLQLSAPAASPAPAPRFAGQPRPMQPAFQPAAVRPQVGANEVAIPADGLGQFSADAQVNGQSVHMLIDTGASFVVLSAAVAERVGIYPPADAQKVHVHTANGDAVATMVTLDYLQIGAVYQPNVQALIADRSAGEVNLVGTSFLRRLASVEQRDGSLYLRQ